MEINHNIARLYPGIKRIIIKVTDTNAWPENRLREFVILPDDTIQPINDSTIKFEKGSDGLYEIGGKKYTLKEAIERL